MKTLVLFFLCVVPCVAVAEPLPDSPRPKPVVSDGEYQHRFWDRTTKIQLVGMAAAGGMDMGQTCQFLANGQHEWNLTQSCGKNVAITAGFDSAALGAAWLLHRTHHHKLERIPMLFMGLNSLYGFAASESK